MNDKFKMIDHIKALIDGYILGTVSAEDICEESDRIADFSLPSYLADERVTAVTGTILPGACADYRNSDPDDPDRDLRFWIGLKDCEFMLERGRTLSGERETYLSGGVPRWYEVELTDEYLRIEPEMQRLVREETGEGGWTGFCHTVWGVKKRILREKYGIDWESPAERFPGIFFD